MSNRAGQLAEPRDLIDVPHLVTAYYTLTPDPENVDQQVAFGTSGHRGSSLKTAFNEAHILAITQAIVDYRAEQGTTGAIFVGRDTHALSEPAMVQAIGGALVLTARRAARPPACWPRPCPAAR